MNKVAFPRRNTSQLEKLKFYDDMMAHDDLSPYELHVIRNRIYRIDTYFESTEAIALKGILLQCIEDLLKN